MQIMVFANEPLPHAPVPRAQSSAGGLPLRVAAAPNLDKCVSLTCLKPIRPKTLWSVNSRNSLNHNNDSSCMNQRCQIHAQGTSKRRTPPLANQLHKSAHWGIFNRRCLWMYFGSYPLCLLALPWCGDSGRTCGGSRNHRANRMCWWTNRRTNSQRILPRSNAIGRGVLAEVTWIG
jgi:hypothetical protein